ncbi:MAG: hypothetical protein AABX48_04700 [Nanoarchaeota archaeon]
MLNKKEVILEFIKKNPNATYKKIRETTKLHPERIFKSLKEAFQEAGVNPPRSFDIKTREQKRQIILDFIKKNPNVGGQIIRKQLKINFSTIFSSIEEAYNLAKVDYPRKRINDLRNRSRKEREEQIINLVKSNHLISIQEIANKTNTQPYHLFKNISEIYKKAGVKKIRGFDKRTIKKQNNIIEFIKKNPLATQREINKSCNTHVQKSFKRGIFEAYERANVKFPYERLKLYGVEIKEIRERSKNFEEEISIKLSGYGIINRLVKTKRGFADVIFERKNLKAIIEIKNYENKEISLSQVKQLNKYLEDCSCNLGFLICPQKPKKDKFLIGQNRIFILNVEELKKIPEIMDGSVV